MHIYNGPNTMDITTGADKNESGIKRKLVLQQSRLRARWEKQVEDSL